MGTNKPEAGYWYFPFPKPGGRWADPPHSSSGTRPILQVRKRRPGQQGNLPVVREGVRAERSQVGRPRGPIMCAPLLSFPCLCAHSPPLYWHLSSCPRSSCPFWCLSFLDLASPPSSLGMVNSPPGKMGLFVPCSAALWLEGAGTGTLERTQPTGEGGFRETHEGVELPGLGWGRS